MSAPPPEWFGPQPSAQASSITHGYCPHCGGELTLSASVYSSVLAPGVDEEAVEAQGDNAA